MKARGLVTSQVLLGGVIFSFLLLATGLIFHPWHPEPGTALVRAGLLVLMATPFVRILVLMFEFYRSGEVFFVMTGIGVLLLLGVSVWIGLG